MQRAAGHYPAIDSSTSGSDGTYTLENVPYGSSIYYTNFIYNLDQSADVTIKVYTISGRLLNELLDDEPRSAGHWQEYWDGTDQNSKPLANGIYFYRITVVPAVGTEIKKTGKLCIMR